MLVLLIFLWVAYLWVKSRTLHTYGDLDFQKPCISIFCSICSTNTFTFVRLYVPIRSLENTAFILIGVQECWFSASLGTQISTKVLNMSFLICASPIVGDFFSPDFLSKCSSCVLYLLPNFCTFSSFSQNVQTFSLFFKEDSHSRILHLLAPSLLLDFVYLLILHKQRSVSSYSGRGFGGLLICFLFIVAF